MRRTNLILLTLVVLLAVVPLFLATRHGGSFSGADSQAQELIDQTHPEYKPWFHAIWTPPSKEIESLLFALQAAIGAGVLGYYMGLKRGKAAAARARQDEPGGTEGR
ncbi:energy-coupling factor ABC transporter substrate-binding protein [bacterium]|nr:energy-coupling factor ABC transporter substrate-binding protein [bacterium]